MTIQVPGVRPKVISDHTSELLVELLRFRHFRRYYFALEFDWRRLDPLVQILFDAHTALLSDLESFLKLLQTD